MSETDSGINSEIYEEEIDSETEYVPSPEDSELVEKIAKRRLERSRRQRRKRRITILIMVVTFAMLATMCGRDIVRLKAENRALKKQQAELQKQRDELKEELKKTGNKDYIREQARKQLRLLNPGEILFTFEDDEESGDK